MFPRSVRRIFVVVLLAGLLMPALPAQAGPLDLGWISAESDVLSEVWSFVRRLFDKEGMSSDPDGQNGTPGDEGVAVDPDGDHPGEGDSGVTIDPDG